MPKPILRLQLMQCLKLLTDFYPSTFVYSRFPQRFSFFTICLVKGEHRKEKKCRYSDRWKKCISDTLYACL